MIVVYIIGGILALWIIGAVAGVGKNTVFKNPRSLSDAQLERTIRLSAIIMDGHPVGSEKWSEAGRKHDAAFQEQQRRRGVVMPASDEARFID